MSRQGLALRLAAGSRVFYLAGMMMTAKAPLLVVGALVCAACSTESSSEALQTAPQAGSERRVEAYYVVLEGGGAAARLPQGMDPRSADATRISRQRIAEIEKQQNDLEPTLDAIGAKTIARLSRLANVVQVLTDERGAYAIEQLAGVVRVERAPLFYKQLNSAVPVTGAPHVWAGVPGYTGDGVTIGIIDSGIDYTHADFGGIGTSADYAGNDPAVVEPGSFPTSKVVGGWDFAGESYDAENSPAPHPDADPLDCATTIGQQISGGHGTHVAGIAAGTGVSTDGSSFLGPYDQNLAALSFRVGPGVAPRASLYALKVFGCQGASTLLGAALDRAADPNLDGSFEDRLDVVNASLGTPYALGASVTGELVSGLNRVGTLLVAAAGNEGQNFFVTGSPASFPEVLSVAASVDNRLINLKVTSPESAVADYPAAEAVFTERLAAVGPVNATLVLAAPSLGCTPLSNAAELAGNIALIDRGTCPFVDKFANAVAAGAIAVIVVDNEAMALPFSMDGAVGASPIPGVMVRLSDGAALKSALQAGPLEVVLDASDPFTGVGSEFIADFSSRGPSATDGRLKPEITAPGVAIDSAAVGTGSAAVSNQGTSMASPIVAGAAALARQAHPTFGPSELKANLMNGAANMRDLAGLVYGTSVVGAGRVDIARSSKAQVTAAAAPSSGEVGVSFGTVIALAETVVERELTVTNHGSEPATIAAEVIPTFTRDGVEVSVTPKQLQLAAGEAATMSLTLVVDPLAVGNPGPDPGTPALQGNQTPLPRHYLNQASGLLRLSQVDHEDVVVPYTGSLRAAVDLRGSLAPSCGDNTGADSTVEVSLVGDGPHPSPVVSAFQLAALDDEDDDAPTDTIVAMTDIRAVGIATNLATAPTFDDAQVFFGVAVSGAWSTPARGPLSVVTVRIDADQAGADEYEIRVEARNPDPPYRDVLVASTYDLASGERIARYPVNVLTPDVAQTNPFNSSILVLSARMAELGINPDAPAFDWVVATERPDLVISSDTAKGSFDAAKQAIDATSFGQESSPMFVGKEPIIVNVSAAARAAQTPLDLLLLHHTNPPGEQWEVISLANPAPGNLVLTAKDAEQPVAPNEIVEATFNVSYSGTQTATQTRLSGNATGATVLSASSSQGSCTVGAGLDCSFGELEPGPVITVVARLSPSEGEELVRLVASLTGELDCEASVLDNEATVELSIESPPVEPGKELQVAGGCTCRTQNSGEANDSRLPLLALGMLVAISRRRNGRQKRACIRRSTSLRTSMRRFTFSLLLVVNCNSYSFEFGQASSAGGDGGTAGTGASAAAGGEGGEGGTGGVDPLLEGAPQADVAVADHTVDLFGKDGNRFWFAVRPEQVELMNQKDGGGFGDIYTPGAGAGDATFVDHLLVTSAEEQPHTANYGKVEVKVIGESTFRPWTPESIPNLRVDMDQFTDGLEVGGVEHLRFNNGLVGSIYRELIAFEVYRGLGYPAPRASFAWVGSNVWGPNVQIPYTLAEVYKTDFCTANSELLGGGCPNMFEFVGDIPFTDFDDPNNCQIDNCVGTRLEELGTIISNTPPGAGFKAATEAYLDWDSVHRFQCLSWILWTGDDAFHNTNNVVLLEKEDGRYIYLPYSVDISGGQEWYQFTPLYGTNSVAYGCQADPECWADTIATCEDTIADFIALDPAALVDSVHERLVAQDMLRPGDEERYTTIRNWYAQRTLDLLPELDQYRAIPCLDPNVKCGDAGECIPVFECNPVCEGADIPCGPVCQPECFDCPYPFSWCGDGSCRGQCF